MKNTITSEESFFHYDYVPIGICIIKKDYSIVFWNKCLEGWSGIKRNEILGKNLFELYPYLNSHSYKTRIDMMFKGMPPTVFSALLHKYFFKFKISQSEYQTHSATLMSLPSNNEDKYYTLIAIENQTNLIDRINSYRELKNQAEIEAKKRLEAEARYRFIIQNISDVIWILNLNSGKFTYISPSIFQLRGMTVDEALNESPVAGLTPESAKIVIEKMKIRTPLFIQNPNDIVYNFEELQQYKKDGSIIWIEVLTRYQYNNFGEIEVIGVSRNIDKRKEFEFNLIKSEAKLKELNSTKDKFFSIIAHDLRNPIGNYKQITKMLHEDYDNFSEEERIDFLRVLKESAEHIYELLENLLEWSRSQRDKIVFEPEQFQFKYLVDSILHLLQLSANNKSIQIINHISEELILETDPKLMNTVIRNLISNAIKFTPKGGLIEIGCLIVKLSDDIKSSKNYSEVSIYVKDSGIGMTEDTMSKIFRIDQNTTALGTDNERGTGLGLILCKEFVEKMGGKIWVESEVGKGSTFWFSLPN